MKQVMLQFLPLVLHIVVGREIPASEHFSRSVDVTVVEGDGGEVQLVAGPLVINLGRVALLQRVPGGSSITLDSLLVKEEGGEVEMEVRREFHQNDSFIFISIEMWMILHFCCRCDMQSKAGSWIQG